MGFAGDGLGLCFILLLIAIKFVLWNNCYSFKLIPMPSCSDLVTFWSSKFIAAA